VPLRALAAAGATALLAVGLLTQSKGGAVALAVSAVAVLAISRQRLRLAVPALGMTLLVAVSYTPLTESFRQRGEDEPLRRAAEAAGERVLWLTLAALVLGAVYAAADRRLELSPRVHRVANVAAVTAVAVGIAAGAALFLARVDSPGDWAGDRWRDFKTMPEREEGSSHLVNLGSNRYDFWRVALAEFRDHPVAGIGARGWYVAYLRDGRSDETPRRAHSLELDVASELGVIGVALLAVALLPPLLVLVPLARGDLVSAGVLAAAVYWLVHATGDWTWTFPAVGIPFFLLLGAALAREDPPVLPSRAAFPAAGAVAAAAVLLLLPPWLSARIGSNVVSRSPDDPRSELTWARRLDPLSAEPLLIEAALAERAADALAPLREAAEKEPRNAAIRYQLGRTLLEAGRQREAERELAAARLLAPRDERIADALRQAHSG
jgi:O-antigen ligase